ncbi:HEAT repeat domain-containing protein [Filimonas effusa]|uniref:HEAT repeat domain-containing protein n=1 Tax=Filimonas effusa TaxID=2508721 RepID=A0A4Q1D5G1_9BACT|nr:HEAT repeat domain-containing protein [Filimonas effusa]RXK83689.1 HEAT repeat domain-containing protein [Filimonas effusa]
MKIAFKKYGILLAGLMVCQQGFSFSPLPHPGSATPSLTTCHTAIGNAAIYSDSLIDKSVTCHLPSAMLPSAFAIVIDEQTFRHTRQAVFAYKEMLEKKEHLSTYIISSSWNSPAEIRSILQKLAAKSPELAKSPGLTTKFPALEGAVLIGQIPVPMVRNAQHLTSAFKMDEQKFPFERSSVASDRFYDDFDLRFRILEHDKKRPLWFYVELEESSPQYISSDIYTARIISHKPGEQAYTDINNFLKKAVDARTKPGKLNHLLAFTGGGYNAESLTAWTDEQQLLRECFPLAFSTAGSSRVLNFRMDSAMKQVIMSELQRPALDLAFLSEHGDIEKQYITNESSGKIITAEIEAIRPSARLVVFNACYNGSFHHPGNIAGAYLFNEGGTIVTQGNTVNVLQDKYAFQLAGLLQEGVRVGIWNSNINSLETHLLGDPTWHFYHQNGEALNKELVANWKNEKFWRSSLNHPSVAIRSLALSRLFALHAPNVDQQASKIFDTARTVNERMQCLSLLAAYGGSTFNKLASKALQDPHEYIRRKAAEWIARSGNDSFIPQLVSLLLAHPNDERVVWSAKRSLAVMDPIKVKQATIQQVGEASYLMNKEQLLQSWLKDVEEDSLAAAKTYAAIISKQLPEAKRIQSIRLLRNNTYHEFIPQLVKMLEDPGESAAIKVQLLEAAGWFSNTYQKPMLLDICRKLSNDKSQPPEISREAQQTSLRLTQWQLL